MRTFTQPRRLRAQASLMSLVLLLPLYGTWDLRWWRHGLLSIPFALQLAALCLFAGLALAAPFDQRRREVVVAPDGLHTRRLWRRAFVPWESVRDVQVRCSWAGDYLVATTPKRLVALDAPYLVLVHSGAARREFEDAADELQRAIAQRDAAA